MAERNPSLELRAIAVDVERPETNASALRPDQSRGDPQEGCLPSPVRCLNLHAGTGLYDQFDFVEDWLVGSTPALRHAAQREWQAVPCHDA